MFITQHTCFPLFSVLSYDSYHLFWVKITTLFGVSILVTTYPEYPKQTLLCNKHNVSNLSDSSQPWTDRSQGLVPGPGSHQAFWETSHRDLSQKFKPLWIRGTSHRDQIDLSPRLVAGISPLVCADLQDIDHFTVVCSVTWSMNGSEARGDRVLIQASLLLLCKSSCSNAN